MPDLKYGKRDPKRAPALQFARYDRTAALADFPPVDYLGRVDWSPTMNGNDKAGDCVACAWANTRALVTTVLAGATEYPTQDMVWTIYKTQNPSFDPNGTQDGNGPGSSADNGMDEQTLLEYLVKNPGPDGKKLLGFAQIDHTNLQELKNAISLGGTVMLGVQVAAAQQSQFPNVWDWVASSPIEGGHAIIAGGHADVASDDVKAACWASEFGTTDAFLTHQLDEAWLLIWEEDAGSDRFITGMDLATFASDFTALTGAQFPVTVTPNPTPGPAPTPTPAPAPAPTPVADQADLTLWNKEARTYVGRRHFAVADKDMAAALATWAEDKGIIPAAPGRHEARHAS